MSKKGMKPSCFCSCVVNCMAGSTEFMCCRNSSFLSCFKMTNVSSTNLFHHLGGSLVLIGLCPEKSPYINWPAQGSQEIPWLAPGFAHNIGLGTGNKYCTSKTLASPGCFGWTWWFSGGVLYPVPTST